MSDSDAGEVLLTTDPSGVWTIQLNRPKKHNAMSGVMAAQLEQHSQRINQSTEARVVILSGAGPSFCSGSDINALDEYPEAWQFHNRTSDYTRSIRRIRKPVLTAMQGHCLGGGLEMAINGDIRIAGESARIGAPEITHGWIGGGGDSQLIPRLTNYGMAMKFLLLGESVTGEEALRMGIVEECVPDDQLLPRVQELAAVIAERAPIAVQATKQAVRASQNMGAEIGLEYENELVAVTFMTEDKEEGVRAFAEKRKPVFKGR